MGVTQPNPAFLDHDRPPVPDLVVPRGVTPFHLEGKPVRGRLVRLGALADALLTRHTAPDAVTRLLGEALALTAGLASALKFRGSFSLQAKGDGPISMLLADCTDSGELRGYARVAPDKLAMYGKNPSARALLGRGYLAFTCDQGPETERYQGIVPIEGQDLTEMTGTYFATSEQLRSHVRLACAKTAAGWRATAFIMERVAGEGGIGASADPLEQEEAWNTALALAGTLKAEELLDDDLAPERLLYRLFHQEGLAVGQSRALAYGCRCSRSRLLGVLEGFPTEDLDHMAEEGTITMTCEFCNFDFRFSRESIDRAAGHA
ncbi:Hsp33 family molecular chaperone HslO [Roseococcus sp. SYP-B2431]|uniref:Hsp33 family molecular chaperone HslO n=1 Tax=Roseococcus sp. SYP-B2431 TaxID=2496640 RepID=UPI00103912A1|nr:Hsp33 family molecular chaperone HslO [Roseococcus sp. SYP-B2431]TCH97986.1 Hsp33 family molecular chaperone HslO [Roseococcus sp. SYP-B2431]